MNNRAEGVRVAHPLFQAEGGGSTPTSALSLLFVPIQAKLACELNELWHSRLPRIPWSNVVRNRYSKCWAAECGGVYYAVAIWSSPVAGPRAFPIESTIELRRLACAPNAPKNTPSRMLGWMARQLPREFPLVTRLISYQDVDVHTGGIYRAAGWTAVGQTNPKEIHWNNGCRDRVKIQSGSAKVRWERAA